jgi:hypothetical protein
MMMDRSTICGSTVTYSEHRLTLLAIYHHNSYYYHHRLMAILPLHGVQQNKYPRVDTPPKRDALPLYPTARHAKWRCYAHVTVGHKWSITHDTSGKKGTTTYLCGKHGWAQPVEVKAAQTISGHAIHLVQ